MHRRSCLPAALVAPLAGLALAFLAACGPEGASPDVLPDVPVDTPPECLVCGDALEDVPEVDAGFQCPGGTFCPCTLFSDCDSGLCVDSMEGSICSYQCGLGEVCPKGWACDPVTMFGETIYGCVPRHASLCRPCRTDDDCLPKVVTGERSWLCIDHGAAGRFCGAPCTTAEECPDEPVPFDCVDVEGSTGTVKQCRPTGGQCPCTEKYARAGFLTTCVIENPFGTCEGVRTCDGACQARTPADESCNLLDDDCDGDTDEGVADVPCDVTNAWGTCRGTAKCESGRQDVCEGPSAGPEACNGQDEDCDGLADDGFPDTDGDGLADCVDPDIDGDDLPNASDNCPTVANPGQQNNDAVEEEPSALLGDACDEDDDNDGIPDGADNCPQVKNVDQNDLDGDHAGDACDCDVDGDIVGNAAPLDMIGTSCPAPVPADNCPVVKNADQGNVDGDDQGDACDCDVDGDGVPNNNPGCPGVAAPDNCRAASNADQANLDGDALGDACDCDIDGDGVTNANPGCTTPAWPDNCPLQKNVDQRDTDHDLRGNACDCDIDGDDVPNENPACPACGGGGQPACDNCPDAPNPGQESTWGAEVGDACNPDWDGDDILNDVDVCPRIVNVDQADTDKDGKGDPCDCDIDGDGFGNAGVNRDGTTCPAPAVLDNCPTIANAVDPKTGRQPDLDLDGQGDACDCDIDGDGDPNANFGCPTPTPVDCDAFNPLVHHGAAEICGNGRDDNCNTLTDENCT